jgi:hypothetical protein
LLETLALTPKKKHFKKAVAHFIEFNEKDKADLEIIELIVKVGITEKYPIFLGLMMKHFLQHGYAIPPPLF